MRYVLYGILAFASLVLVLAYQNDCYWRGTRNIEEYVACIAR